MTDIVKLNVGGRSFMTRRSTLTSIPNTMLSQMFSGQLQPGEKVNDEYFIDRDGDLFVYILAYLRNKSLPKGRHLLKQLLSEARYFCIQGLISDITTLLEKKSFIVWCEETEGDGITRVMSNAPDYIKKYLKAYQETNIIYTEPGAVAGLIDLATSKGYILHSITSNAESTNYYAEVTYYFIPDI